MAERITVPRFVGGTGRLASGQVSRERTINRVIERSMGLGGKVERYLRGRPGLTPFAQVNDTDTSEFLYQDGACFCCTGTTFSEVFQNGTTFPRGTITYNATRRATLVCSGTVGSGSGGHQVLIVSSAGDVYVYDTLTQVFAAVAFPAPVAMCEFLDGYFLALSLNSRRVYYSALSDALTWDFTFGYFEVSWASDNIYAIKRAGRQLWCVGTKTTELYADTGNATNPFAPIQGALLDVGSLAPHSVQRDGETLTWVSQSEHGGGRVVRATGYTPQQVSTYPIDILIQQPSTIGSLRTCEAFVQQIDGHRFYHLSVPTIDTTPTLDYDEAEWTEWAMWDKAQAVFTPYIGRCHAYAFELHLIGVRESGIIYQESFSLDDDGVL